ncbi:60S ribosomal protein L35 [Iris pallida]|uniref:60S ribosomal protein L35 n=1 Tax=Iris pallida TaxID=29817 RepID=A0AAX6H1P5_IRIPA|nr:60S ribosomal protein L35 [Iris pallida]
MLIWRIFSGSVVSRRLCSLGRFTAKFWILDI